MLTPNAPHASNLKSLALGQGRLDNSAWADFFSAFTDV
jgi:hypothetical protein